MSGTLDLFNENHDDRESLDLSSNEAIKQFCMDLIYADSEAEVIELLKKAGFWDDPKVWRFYGDNENNFSTTGNQQSRPEAALVEKIINSVDAKLTNECLVRGIDPKGANAPADIKRAVADFFDEGKTGELAGRISEWLPNKRTEISRGITLAATGSKPRQGNPCFTITDSGEGQCPDDFPNTLLSLNKDNKLRIPFVQGKFNMGGTGVLQFCGTDNLQLILSKRNPKLISPTNVTDGADQWGFTVVRRENPIGGRRSSVYTYLAPLDAENEPNHGRVLRFDADKLPIFPEGDKAYTRQSEYGTLIKLYDYMATGFKSHILMKSGLLSRIDLLLPDVALPVRFHECRGYEGHKGSHDTTLTGVCVRLDDDKGDNLEHVPWPLEMNVSGEKMSARIYAFKKGKADTYRRSEGVIFVVNGQTHGHLQTGFFRRAGLSYIADSLLVIIDCSDFSGRAREDLFMNSRDRLRGTDLREAIEARLIEQLKDHQGLRDLKDRRRQEAIESKIKDNKPLGDIVQNLLKSNPILSSIFLDGTKLSDPVKKKLVRDKEVPFKGERFPSYFRFKGHEYGYQLNRSCHINMRSRITFETDVVDDYFNRRTDYGEFQIKLIRENGQIDVDDYALNLSNGLATLSIHLPPDSTEDEFLLYEVQVTDSSQLSPFVNQIQLEVKAPALPDGTSGKRKKPPVDEEGSDREIPGGITIPEVISVKEEVWESEDPPFDKYTALRIKHVETRDTGDGKGTTKEIYDFFINVDNFYLKHEIKRSIDDADLTLKKFETGMVLIGMGLIQEDLRIKKTGQLKSENTNGNIEQIDIEDQVDLVTRSVAPMILPMIEYLGNLSPEEQELLLTVDDSS